MARSKNVPAHPNRNTTQCPKPKQPGRDLDTGSLLVLGFSKSGPSRDSSAAGLVVELVVKLVVEVVTMKTYRFESLLLSAVLLTHIATNAAETKTAAAPAPYPERLQWWRTPASACSSTGARSASPARKSAGRAARKCPIEEYDNLYKQFNPTKFNADEWVRVAKAAGMKYIVLTTKHHDGFCLWDTKQTDYNIMNTPFKRDVVKELAAACKKAGHRLRHLLLHLRLASPGFPAHQPRRQGRSARIRPRRLQPNTCRRRSTNSSPTTARSSPSGYDVPQKFDEAAAPDAHQAWPRQLQPRHHHQQPHRRRAGDYDTPEQTIGASRSTARGKPA